MAQEFTLEKLQEEVEYIKRFEAMKILRFCYKRLKPDRKIRIVEPDFDIIVQQ